MGCRCWNNKCKKELQEQFGYFINGGYNKITDAVLKEFIEEYHSGDYPKLDIYEIRNWTHNNDKKEWIGEFKSNRYHSIYAV